MRYYVMEPIGNILLPSVPKSESAEVIQSSNLSRFSEIDYDYRGGLISDRLKLLMTLYLPKYDFQPIVYLDTEKNEQAMFWRFCPPLYEDYQATYRNDGFVSHISFPNTGAPIVFTARSPKGVRSVIVRMAVAESALRRSIVGLKFTKILELEKG